MVTARRRSEIAPALDPQDLAGLSVFGDTAVPPPLRDR